MPLSKLSIFSKDTDANAVIKGYEYQKLRTIENWLHNKVNNVDELIYCEFEEDIFQRDITTGTSKFRQLKLYTNRPFSFASEEIVKGIAHFFMLYVKGEYSFDQVEFVFETNMSVAAKYGNNDAELLSEWAAQQDSLNGVLLDKCVAKVKSIVTDYIKTEYPKVLKGDKTKAQEAILEFNQMPDSVWEDFTKSIKWQFDDIDPDKAVENSISNIKKLISSLPFPSSKDKGESVFTTLYYEVSEKMYQAAPENRCLTNERLDSLILDLGDEADKQYNIAYEAWKNTAAINYFRPAEFLEVLNSANHCRQKSYLKGHSMFWLDLLDKYIQFTDTAERYRQKAIYEFLWLSLRPEWLATPEGTLVGQGQLVEQYFSNIVKFDDHDAVEDHWSLLQIVMASIVMDKCDISIDKATEWMKEIGALIESKVETTVNPSEKCFWLELKSSYLNNPLKIIDPSHETKKDYSCFYQILELLPEAPYYNVSRLNDRLDQYIKIYIQLDDEDGHIDELEKIADKLMPFVTARDGNHATAKTYVDRGVKYLHTTNPRHIVKALHYFHKAKDLWLQEETAEGYVLALLNISQLYLAVNQNLAAKYYALAAAWFSINNDPDKLGKRVASAFGLIAHADFNQGAWVNSLDAFELYNRMRIEFDSRPFDDSDRTLVKTLVEAAFIVTMTPQVSIQMSGYIEHLKQRMGPFYKEYLEHLVDEHQKILASTTVEQLIQDKLDASPISDIGPTRIIEWKAFGSIWKVSFPNTWLMNSLGEEFCAVLQVLLVELSNLELDLHFIRTTVEIEVAVSEDLKTPEQLRSNTSFKWRFYTKRVDVAEGDPLRIQMASLVTCMKYLLRDVSMLQDDRFFEIVDGLFKEDALAYKTMTVNLYQRIYRNVFPEDPFELSRRNSFARDIIEIKLSEDPVLAWNESLSPLYSKEESLSHIKGRFKNMYDPTHLTIAHIKGLPGYTDWLQNLRSKGWLDWQILMAMYNHICDYKAKRIIEDQSFETDDLWKAAYEDAFHEIRLKKEEEFYVEFPLDYFKGPEFESQLDHSLWLVLHTWGLENRASFPNFPSIRDFLRHRFNVGIDDVPELSPFNSPG